MAKCSYYHFGKVLSSPSEGDEIVVTGISGRYPQSKNVEELFEHIINKRDLLTAIPDEWRTERTDLPPRMGRLDDRNKFDSGFFGAHYRDANILHPSSRMLIETAFEALIDAGLNPADVKGANMGVFLGAFHNGFELPYEQYESVNFEFNWLTKGGMAEKVSYYLGLEGPTGCMDVACGSSGYALDHAFRTIRSGQCDSAIVAGANLIFTPNVTGMLTDLHVLDKDGENNVFGENAKGYVRSEGIFAIVLQKLKDSKRVYAQIVHTNTNSNGFNDKGMFHPSLKFQAQLFDDVYRQAGVDPSKVDFIEVHSTGTKVGDLAEIAAIEAVFCRNRNAPLMVGSGKSNFAHAETASGLSSLIKVLVAMEKNWMPPNINCANVRTDVAALKDGRVTVLKEPWCLDNKTYFGVNNFGIGGNNEHVLIKKIQKNCHNQTLWRQQLVLVSGRTAKSVQNLLKSIGSNQADQDYFDLLRHTFRFDIKGFPWKGFAVLSHKTVTFQSCKRHVGRKPLVSLCFYGTSEHYSTMCKELCEIPIFSEELQKVSYFISGGQVNSKRFTVLQTIAIQIALIQVLKSLDLPVDNVSGSAISKAYVAGKIDAKQSISLASQIFEFLGQDGHTFRALKNDEEQRLRELITNTLGMTLDSFLENGHKSYKNIYLCFGKGSYEISTLASFLSSIGRLYEVGLNPNLQMLYPRNDWPVKAPLISPLIDWNHEEDWFLPPPCLQVGTEQTFFFEPSSKQYAYLLGHCIDGRMLLGGVLGLTFVWKLFAQMASSATDKMPVFIENIKWHRPLVLSKNSNFELTVQICKLSKRFVVTHSNDVLITGSIKAKPKFAPLEDLQPFKETKGYLQRNTFYKLMSFRHYLYSDQYVGIDKISSDGTQALIKWRNNWTVFIDHMATMIILHERTKDMMLLSSLGSIMIDPQVQMNATETARAAYNIFRSSAAELRGLVYSRTTKKPNLDNPTLRCYKYVPYQGVIVDGDKMRYVVMIVLDNIATTSIHILEILEASEQHSLDNAISEVLAECPIISKVSKAIGNPSEWEYDLVITSDKDNVPTILSKIKEGAFVLLRQPPGHVTKLSDTIDNAVIVSLYHTQYETIILFRKISTYHNVKVVQTSSGFSVSKIENLLEKGQKILLVAVKDNHSGILGLMNSLRANHRTLVSCVFIIGDSPDFNVENAFYKKQLKKGLATNILNNGKWGIHLPFPVKVKKTECSHAIGTVEKGNVKNVRWIQGPLGTATTDDLVEVAYTGLNFHDALVASGKINPTVYAEGIEPNSLRLGMEFSGRNLRGKKVMGLVRDAALSNMVEPTEFFTWGVPEEWSLEDAATVPCSYTIALYTLKILAKVKPGQRVLVHAGSGGIGQACLNIATFLGCTIFTTVGTREKMRLLKKHYPTIQDTHIGYTHDTSFEQLVLEQTRGRRVDIILNCFSEKKMHAGLRCLSRGGRFFDISNVDAIKNENLDISHVSNGRTFYEVTLHAILNSNIFVKQKLSKLMYEGIRLGYVKPLLRLTCNTNHVEEALELMATSRHLGKVVVRVENKEKETSKPLSAIPKFYGHPAKVYIFTGELDGFGVELADWLITQGVRNLIIASKESFTDYHHFKIREWKARGANVFISSHSTLSLKECRSLIIESSNLGIVHGVFNVMPNANITTKSLQNLDVVTRDLCPNLRYFVNCSSTSIGKGTDHCMVNAITNRICEDRKSKGFPALAIEWGPIDDLQFPKEDTAAPGMIKQRLSSCLQVLDIFLTQANAVVSSVIPIKNLMGESKDDDLLLTLAQIIGIDIGSISLQSTLSELGMDSISSVEIKQFLEDKFKIVKSFNDLRNITLSELKAEAKK